MDVDTQLSRLLVHFGEGRGNESTWRLGVNVKLSVADPDWSPEHDAALLDVLQGLSALKGLPHGVAAREKGQWEQTAATLKALKERIASAHGVTASRGKGHNCSPGFDCAGCKQVRTAPWSSFTFWSGTGHTACTSVCPRGAPTQQ
jgi:hypothetical protein